jgi:hypothetical protein
MVCLYVCNIREGLVQVDSEGCPVHVTLILTIITHPVLLQVRAVFARHNLLDDFDSWSDISVWHKIRVPPTIFFYDGGAVVSASSATEDTAYNEHT